MTSSDADPKQKHHRNIDESSPFYANNDASSYNSRYLKSIRNKPRYQELHFYAAPVDLIDELFPKKPGMGGLHPPRSYRASAAALTQWRNMYESDQLIALEKESKEEITNGTKGVPGNVAQLPSVNLSSQQQAVNGESLDLDAVAVPVTKMARTDDTVGAWFPSDKSLNVDFCKDRACKGITLKLLRDTYPNDLSLISGFAILAGESMQYKANVYARGLGWPYACDPGIVGCLVHETSTSLPTELRWICIQTNVAPTDNSIEIVNDSKLDGIHFHHAACVRNSATLLCSSCSANLNPLVELCRAASQK